MHDVIVIGGGQAGLALGYYLRRTGMSYVILDAQAGPGGAWRCAWESLRLFSPAQWSSLPGWIMPGGESTYPTRAETIDYLTRYEERYALPVERPVWVEAVRREGGALRVEGGALRVEGVRGAGAECRPGMDRGAGGGESRPDVGGTAHGERRVWRARAVVSATGTWRRPRVPRYPGQERFRGRQLHSAEYRSPAPFVGQRVLVVGGGNSGAQILAELSRVAETTWVTLEPPTFLPDYVDGRYLFDQATARYRARQAGEPEPPRASLGDIVMVEPVREARARGALESVRPFERFTEHGVVWPDGRETPVDAVIWCTGFRPALDHLAPLGVIEEDGRVRVEGTRSVREPRLWLVGYGEWTGFASATIIGVGRTARATVAEIEGARMWN